MTNTYNQNAFDTSNSMEVDESPCRVPGRQIRRERFTEFVIPKRRIDFDYSPHKPCPSNAVKKRCVPHSRYMAFGVRKVLDFEPKVPGAPAAPKKKLNTAVSDVFRKRLEF